MDIYDIILVMLRTEGGIRGRTAIQKLAYLVKEIHPEFAVPEYKPHYYGPFSPKVGAVLAKLVSYSFAYEKRMVGSRYSGYRYELTEDGEKVVKDVEKRHPEQYEKIRRLVDTCEKLCGLSVHSLSFAAKIRFMQTRPPHNGTRMSDEDLQKYGEGFGWDIGKRDIDDGIKLLKGLNISA